MLKYIAVLTLIVAMLVAGCAAPAAQLQPPRNLPVGFCPSNGSSSGRAAYRRASRTGIREITLTIESWRNDDLTIWQDVIIPAFNGNTRTSKSSSRRPRRPNTTASSMPSWKAAPPAT